MSLKQNDNYEFYVKDCLENRGLNVIKIEGDYIKVSPSDNKCHNLEGICEEDRCYCETGAWIFFPHFNKNVSLTEKTP